MKPKLNRLVTCYNKEKYISYIITMLKEQLLKYNNDVEVHIYDDGSTDNSTQIIDQILKDYQGTNIKKNYLPHNLGTGSIRELALQNVNSEYFIFIDADDLISENYLDKIMQYINDNNMADIHHFGVRVYPIGGTICFSISLWDKVIKTDFVKNNNLHFNTNLCNMEDADFMERVFPLNPTIEEHLEDILYVYNISIPNTLTHNGDVWLNNYDNIKEECR